MAKKTKTLENLVEERDQFDVESRSFIDSLVFVKNEIATINTMKSTPGWKMLENKIREELKIRILQMVKDDLKIQTLLALLNVADTKSMSQALQEEIDKVLPEE